MASTWQKGAAQFCSQDTCKNGAILFILEGTGCILCVLENPFLFSSITDSFALIHYVPPVVSFKLTPQNGAKEPQHPFCEMQTQKFDDIQELKACGTVLWEN